MTGTVLHDFAAAEAAIHATTSLLGELRDAHARLERRAVHVEAELCRTNDVLAEKVRELGYMTRSLEAVLAAIPTGVVVYDEHGRIVRANPAAVAMLGVPTSTLLEAPTASYAALGLAGSRADGARQSVECADNQRRVLVRRCTPYLQEDGGQRGAVETLDDQTELADAEERMRRLTRAAALGTMVGGVAHEVRNPLHAIAGFADLLEREAPADSRLAKHAGRIRAGVRDLEAIVNSMLGVARQGRLQLETGPLRPAVEAAIAAVRSTSSAHTIELVSEELQATFDPIELRQALRNLITNACDAQPGGGVVRVDVRAEGDGVLLQVHDAGPGVPESAREHLFDPFFTTRAEGTGLGLALVARIAELHGGSLRLASKPGPLGGATFELRLGHPHQHTPSQRPSRGDAVASKHVDSTSLSGALSGGSPSNS